MQITIYDLPPATRGRTSLERKIRELLLRIRNGFTLAPEEADWLDWAELNLDHQMEPA